MFSPEQQLALERIWHGEIRKCVACAAAESTMAGHVQQEHHDRHGMHAIPRRVDT